MTAALDLVADGAEHLPATAFDLLPELHAMAASLPQDKAGVRTSGNASLRGLLGHDGMVGRIVVDRLGRSARAVRAILFDKSAAINWSLPWHQDRTICVRRRIGVAGYGPWTVKRGMQHVAPPSDLLSRMLTLRIHLDDVPEDNGLLLIAPGSHALGSIRESAIDGIVHGCGIHACLARAGDVWIYATPILHASRAAVRPARRRVLQIDFSADDLPGGLEWLGV